MAIDTVISIVRKLIESGVFLYVDGTELKYKSKKGGITEKQKKQVKENKEEIITYLLKLQKNEPQQNLKLPDIKVRDSFNNIILSYGQQRLWFIDQLGGHSVQYNMHDGFPLQGEFNECAFKKAIKAILDRHEVLRTCYTTIEGQTRQEIKETYDLPFVWHNLSQLSNEEKTQQVNKISENEASVAFNLSEDLMLRIQVLTLTANDHLVFYTLHHIASDGWSLGIFKREFTLLYETYCKGKNNPLVNLKFQYADYALWQREWLQEDVIEKQLGYWKKHLRGIAQLHSLALDKTRPKKQTFIGKMYQQQLSKELTNKIRVLCDKHEVTLFMFLETAFTVLLSRYSNETDIVIGSPVSGRNHRDLENVIGFFVNTLVLRTNLSNIKTFGELLKSNKQIILDAYENQHIPFEKLVQELSPVRHLNQNSIVQILFDVQNSKRQALNMNVDGEKEGVLSSREMSIAFELKLDIHDFGDVLSMTWFYNKSLFNDSTIFRMAANYNVLLGSIIDALLASEEPHLEHLTLLSETEQKTLLLKWNENTVNYPKDKCIHELFEKQVEKTPDFTAVIFEDKKMTYRELNEQSNRLAHYLIEQGVKPGSLVALCVTRSFETMIVLLGIFKAGAAYVPLDPQCPTARLDYMLDDCGAMLVVSQSNLLEKIVIDQQQTICLDDPFVQSAINKCAISNLHVASLQLTPYHCAYVIYTSGSTGLPKGVVVNHTSVCNFLNCAKDLFITDNIDGSVVSSPLAFDATVQSLYLPLCVGKYVKLLPENSQLLETLADNLLNNKHNLLFKITPTHLNALSTQHLAKNSSQSKHVVVVAGESLNKNTVQPWLALLPAARFINEYGPTEATVGSCTFVIPEELDFCSSKETVPIGRPLANVQFYVLDKHLNVQPIGVSGELYIGGAGLAREYLQQPELTKTSFIVNPFSSIPGARLYKTGDLVRYLENGNLEFIGRTDDQVKIRGFRIELGEIENILLEHEIVLNSVVLAREDEWGGKYLVAYVVLAKSIQNTQQDVSDYQTLLCRHLQEVLPEYMVPAAYVVLEDFPLTPSGKVDKKCLPTSQDSDLQKQEYVAARNETEKTLCKLWQDLLGVERVGVFDNFFALGGHSLLATRLVSLIREQFTIELPLRVIFESPTVAGLSEKLKTSDDDFFLPPVMPADRDQDLPLSYSQQRLWFIDQLGEGSAQYNLPGYFLLQGKFNVIAFKQALKSLLDRHEVLRTHFASVAGEVRQIIVKDYVLPFTLHDVSQLNDAEKTGHVQHLLQNEVATAFNLNADLMLRVKLLKLSDTHHLIFYTMHHIASDGWSRTLFQNELSVLYKAYSQQQDNPLPPLKVQYADYALWQRQWLQGEVLSKALSYWKRQLDNLPLLHRLPLDKPRPAKQRFMGKSFQLFIDKKLTTQIKQLNQHHNSTLFMFMHTALSVLLSRYSGEKDIVVGSAITGRSHRDVEGLIGFFINDLVLRINLLETHSFAELIEQHKQTILDAYNYSYIPFEMLVEELNPQRSMSHSPLFQIKLDIQNNEQTTLSMPNLELVDVETNTEKNTAKNNIVHSSEHSIKHDLYISVAEQDEGLSLSWRYNTDLFFESSIESLSTHFIVLLTSIVEAPEQSIESLKLLTPAQEKTFLQDFNGVVSAYPRDKCIHELFETQVDLNPHKTAVIYQDETLNYQQLNQQANQLAHYLIEQGIKPDSLVALCLERSVDMLVAILGVLKAGGAYVPLDPNTPQKRLDCMLEDCACQWVLSQGELLSELSFGDRWVMPIDAKLRKTLLLSYSNTNPSSQALGLNSTQLAYVIYTSGTTGQAKGVMVEHDGLVKYCDYAREFYYQADLEGSLVASSYNFDLTVPSLYLPLLVGGNVKLLDEGKELEHLADILATTHKAYLLRLTPSHLTGVLALLADNKQQTDKDIHCQHVFIIGGEPLAVTIITALQERFPRARIYNHYGPTESIVGCSLYALSSDSDLSTYKYCPIGRAMNNTQLLVLNEQLQLNPVGVPGELYIGGKGLARGYFNNPLLTAQTFISNPFTDNFPTNDFSANNTDNRLYKTGDLVRWLADGNLEFIGRVDNQVKIRGLRIELGEIEQGLLLLAGIGDCAVAVHKADDEDQRLVAYVVLDEDLTTTLEDETALIQRKEQLIHAYRAALGTLLPDYMVPLIYLFLDHLPLTANGKLDRQALPTPEDADLLKSRYVAPRNTIETQLCALWQDVLKLKQVGIEDDFFLLGGHSLLATRLINVIRNEFKIEIPLRVLFEKTTISELSEEIMECVLHNKSLENETQLMADDDIDEVILE